MKLKITFFLSGIFLFSYGFFTFLALGEAHDYLNERKNFYLKMNRELSYKVEKIEKLKEVVSHENIQVLEERKALEKLLSKVEKLKKTYNVDIAEDLRKEGNMWKVDLFLSFKISNSKEAIRKMKPLVEETSPLVDIKAIVVDRESGEVSIKASLIQPFVGREE